MLRHHYYRHVILVERDAGSVRVLTWYHSQCTDVDTCNTIVIYVDTIVIIPVERGADGVRVLNWYHRQFIEAARERCCQNEEKLAYLHSGLAEFFSGTWSGGMLN